VIRTFAADQQFSAIQYDGTIYTSARHLHLRGSVMMTITYKVAMAAGDVGMTDTWQQVDGPYRGPPFTGDPVLTGGTLTGPLGITCPRCGLTSYHPRDIAEGYCARCHDWTTRKAR